MKVLGIDPGKGGGLAVIDSESHEVIDVTAMPETLADISDFVERHKDAQCAYIEIVHSMPKQGVSSTFTFGQFYGYVQMAVACHKIRCIDVLPSKWQTALSVKSKKDESYTQHKTRLKGKAQQLFPKTKVTLKNADALLIAEYGRMKENGSL
ncbi:crossover junction endodeoxyribonuclease RuvC [Prevotella communis]|uniref:crossover junction endodeoxyribonuclease RuvC n=1 Tax=Prevotella communis TaxID=2913614 RepID=UPI001EDC0C52|nr:crossover junction endodeoxyribonuclease RuvC [Prevotella communis]UKK61128.1 crossover junction endodeoxyribonuclease RuvC [Prevotella communis]UKK63952.1 crossover junction endodeoxyribonuclease RuvC [Prevotella communis]